MDLNDLFGRYIGRVVAFVLTPLLVTVAPVVANAVNTVLGTGYNDQQVSNIAIAMVVGVAAVAWQWLRNNGLFEKAVLEANTLYEAGSELIVEDSVGAPVPEDARESLGLDPNRPKS